MSLYYASPHAHLQHHRYTTMCIFEYSYYLQETILLPSANVISLFSTRFFSIQVTWVGALSASSTTSTVPDLTARTYSHIVHICITEIIIARNLVSILEENPGTLSVHLVPMAEVSVFVL